MHDSLQDRRTGSSEPNHGDVIRDGRWGRKPVVPVQSCAEASFSCSTSYSCHLPLFPCPLTRLYLTVSELEWPEADQSFCTCPKILHHPTRHPNSCPRSFQKSFKKMAQPDKSVFLVTSCCYCTDKQEQCIPSLFWPCRPL